MFRHSVSVFAFVSVILPAGLAHADPDAGAYLAARHAGQHNDFANGARYFTKGLVADPSNAYLLENAMTSFIALGQVERAIPVAQALVDHGHASQIAHLVLAADAADKSEWDRIFLALEQGRGIGPLVDGLSQAWAHMGLNELDKAMDSFDQVIEADAMRVYGQTHKAYALASVGDFEAAHAVFENSTVDGLIRYSRRSAMAHAQILSQLGRNDEAIAVLDGLFGNQRDPGIAALYDRLAEGQAVPYNVVSNPKAGFADILHVIAGAVKGDAPDAFALLYAQASTYLAPENTSAILLSAGLLEDLGRFELANATYALVAADDPSYHAAELGRAEVLTAAGREDAAIEVLQALTRSHPDLPQVHASKGDTLRQVERYDEANAAYSRALDLYDDQSPVKWFVHYTRGITSHLADNWPAAEADFRAALALRPDHPQVLNYLGYSLVERGEKMEEALQMIETAAAARPDNGAIIDSLGWVLFQLERYEDAVVQMERAASLQPSDPVINDHLGDAYWAVGRRIEAQFQWQRALSFEPSEEEADRIRDKLARGLDLVLLDEGEDPIRLARGED